MKINDPDRLMPDYIHKLMAWIEFGLEPRSILSVDPTGRRVGRQIHPSTFPLCSGGRGGGDLVNRFAASRPAQGSFRCECTARGGDFWRQRYRACRQKSFL